MDKGKTFTKEDVQRIMNTIPYSDCGQAMYTIARLEQHNQICSYCKAAIRNQSIKIVRENQS